MFQKPKAQPDPIVVGQYYALDNALLKVEHIEGELAIMSHADSPHLSPVFKTFATLRRHFTQISGDFALTFVAIYRKKVGA